MNNNYKFELNKLEALGLSIFLGYVVYDINQNYNFTKVNWPKNSSVQIQKDDIVKIIRDEIKVDSGLKNIVPKLKLNVDGDSSSDGVGIVNTDSGIVNRVDGRSIGNNGSNIVGNSIVDIKKSNGVVDVVDGDYGGESSFGSSENNLKGARIEDYVLEINSESNLVNIPPNVFGTFKSKTEGKTKYIFNYSLPDILIGNFANLVTLKAQNVGFGVDTIHKLGNTQLQFNYDEYGTDNSRIGGDLSYDFGNVVVGVAYDKINGLTPKEQFLSRMVYDISNNDQFGMALVKKVTHSNSAFNGNLDFNSALAYWIHHGEDVKWGNRTKVRVDSQGDFNRVNLESIWIQNPDVSVLGKNSSNWMLERNVGGAYDVSTVKNIMGSSPVNLVENSKKGLVAAISADVENGNISLLKTQIGYTLPPSNNGVKFGFNGVYSHKPYDVNGDSFGLSSYYSKGSVKLEGKVSNDAWKLNFNYRF